MSDVDIRDREITYRISVPYEGRRGYDSFSPEEKELLRPIAETLAMLDGNAFFTMDPGHGAEWYEQYLVEAWYIWDANGGLGGWAGEASWAREHRLRNDNRTLRGLHEQYRTALALSGSVDGYDGI